MNDEIALVQLEVYDARLEELDIEAALTTRQTLCAMRLTQCSADQTSPFSECYFLRIVFDSDGYLTATTCIAFSYLQGIRAVSQVGVPYGNRTRVAAEKEKRFTGILRKPAAWIAP